MLAERSWYFGYGNTVRVSADPYFDFISFTKIKRRPKKEPNKTKKAKKIKQQHEKQLRQQQYECSDTQVQAKK